MKFKGIALSLISSLIFFACNRGVEPNHELSIMSSDSLITREINDPLLNKYGIPADSFDIVLGKIRKNTFVSDILLKAGIPMQDIDMALKNSRNVFDVRKVLPGRSYALLYAKNNPGRASYMIYEHEPATDYVFSFKDSLNITAFRKKVNTVVQYASGTITSSLWEAIINQDLNPQIAVEMANNIFAWSVDFFGLEKGDKFKIVYEENFIEGQSLGIKKILTAQFISSGKEYTAIPFIQNGTESYFDLDGNSLKKAFLKAPLKFSRISSHYTTSRLHPILKIRRPHLGVDYAAPTGTPVYTVGDGKVLSVTYDAASGRMIKIKHNSSYMTAYMHLSRFERGITPGTMVRQGQIIGYVGSTGLATGPHLDFRFYNNGTPVDPLKVTAPPAEPITEVNRDRFNMIKEVNLSLLNTI